MCLITDNNQLSNFQEHFLSILLKPSSCKLGVPTVDVYQQNVKGEDRLMSVQIVAGINVAVGVLLTINIIHMYLAAIRSS
jgi:hypothetical protein